jgi:O-antigen/teichoic acid export membrane protein
MALHTAWKALIDGSRRVVASDFVHSVAETIGTRFMLLAIGIVTSVVVARILGPEGRGLYAVAGVVGGLGVQFCNLGMHASGTFHVAKDRTLLPALLGNALLLSFGVGGGVAVAAGAVLSVWPGIAPVRGFLLILSLAYVPFGLLYLLLQNLLLGVHLVRAFNISDILNRVLSVATVGVLILVSAVSVESVFAAGILPLAVCSVIMMQRLRALDPRFPSPSRIIFLENLRYGLKAYATDLLAFLVLRANVLIVQYMLGAKSAGYYSVAVATCDIVYMYPVVVGSIFFPRVVALSGESEQWASTRRMALSVALQMFAICAIAVGAARPLIVLLYGKAFEPSVGLFYIGLAGVYFLSVQTILVKYLAARGYPMAIVWIWSGLLIVNLSLTVFLVSRIGVAGAMIASACSNACLLLLVAWLCRRHRRVSPIGAGESVP